MFSPCEFRLLLLHLWKSLLFCFPSVIWYRHNEESHSCDSGISNWQDNLSEAAVHSKKISVSGDSIHNRMREDILSHIFLYILSSPLFEILHVSLMMKWYLIDLIVKLSSIDSSKVSNGLGQRWIQQILEIVWNARTGIKITQVSYLWQTIFMLVIYCFSVIHCISVTQHISHSHLAKWLHSWGPAAAALHNNGESTWWGSQIICQWYSTEETLQGV